MIPGRRPAAHRAQGPRARSPAERILEAADRLFYLHGIRVVGVDALAEEARVSKRTLYNHYPTKDDLIAAYLVGRFKHIAPSDAPAREQILAYFDRLEHEFQRSDFRGCAYVNAVCELSDPKHPAAGIARRFKEQRRQWYSTLLERLGIANPDALARQLQLLAEGALSAHLVWGDPTLARTAREAAEVLIDTALKTTAAKRSHSMRRAKRLSVAAV
ncbi:MAG TPA: TetR family transcriptional regulator [Casimicrobiaceae bacterium]|nr:TetR family transcriptional regulator [Casimicrobiaceae bacterium]